MDALDIVENKEVAGCAYETCASAKAEYNEEDSELQVKLDAFVRRFVMRGKDFEFRPPWLPRNDLVRMHVSPGEAADAAKDVFHCWAQKVKSTVPAFSEWKKSSVWLPG